MTSSDASEPDAKSSGSTLKYVMFGIGALILICGLLSCAGSFLVLATADPVDPADPVREEASVESIEPADEGPKAKSPRSSKAKRSDKDSKGPTRKKSKGKRKSR